MKKAFAVVLALALACSSFSCVYAQGDEDYEDYEQTGVRMDYPNCGLTIYVPYDMLMGADLGDGMIDTLFSQEVSYRSGIFLTELVYLPGSGADENLYLPLVTFLCLKDGYNEEIASDPEFSDLIPGGDLEEVAAGDDYTHYVSIGTEHMPDSLTQEEADTYQYLLDITDDIVFGSRYYEPEDEASTLKRKNISFQTTDMNGAPVDSADLFAQNEITMLNLWATTCGPCKDELPDLARIHKRLQQEGCGIVGLVFDTVDQAHMDSAKKLCEEAGADYPLVCCPDNLDELFDITGFPCTYFIDRDGNILGAPVHGNQVDQYEPAVEILLAGLRGESGAPKTSLSKNDSGKAEKSALSKAVLTAGKFETAGKSAPEKDAPAYSVVCVDESGNAVEGVMVQFCSDAMCQFGTTDAEGIAVFDSEPGHYTVHLLSVPSGYAGDETEYEAPACGGEMTIQLKAE